MASPEQVDAGKLRHRVAIERATFAQNSLGENVPTWAILATVWGSVDPLRGREAFMIQQYQADADFRIRIRFYPGITTKDRLVYNGRVFNIININNLAERDRTLEIICKELA